MMRKNCEPYKHEICPECFGDRHYQPCTACGEGQHITWLEIALIVALIAIAGTAAVKHIHL